MSTAIVKKRVGIVFFIYINSKKNYKKIIKAQLNDLILSGVLTVADLHVVINISDEAYQYMISTEVPSFSTKSAWNKMNKEQKLIAHLNEIASNLGGKLIDYTVYPD